MNAPRSTIGSKFFSFIIFLLRSLFFTVFSSLMFAPLSTEPSHSALTGSGTREKRNDAAANALERELRLEMDPRECCLADAADCENKGSRPQVDIVFRCHVAHRPIGLAHDLVKLLVDP